MNILITSGPCINHYPPGGMVLIIVDFNGDLGNSLGDKGKREPNLRGLKLLDFANYLNLCPVNLILLCFRLYLSPKLFTEQYQISQSI